MQSLHRPTPAAPAVHDRGIRTFSISSEAKEYVPAYCGDPAAVQRAGKPKFCLRGRMRHGSPVLVDPRMCDAPGMDGAREKFMTRPILHNAFKPVSPRPCGKNPSLNLQVAERMPHAH